MNFDFMYANRHLLLKICGALLVVDGYGNVLYWWRKGTKTLRESAESMAGDIVSLVGAGDLDSLMNRLDRMTKRSGLRHWLFQLGRFARGTVGLLFTLYVDMLVR